MIKAMRKEVCQKQKEAQISTIKSITTEPCQQVLGQTSILRMMTTHLSQRKIGKCYLINLTTA